MVLYYYYTSSTRTLLRVTATELGHSFIHNASFLVLFWHFIHHWLRQELCRTNKTLGYIFCFLSNLSVLYCYFFCLWYDAIKLLSSLAVHSFSSKAFFSRLSNHKVINQVLLLSSLDLGFFPVWYSIRIFNSSFLMTPLSSVLCIMHVQVYVLFAFSANQFLRFTHNNNIVLYSFFLFANTLIFSFFSLHSWDIK